MALDWLQFFRWSSSGDDCFDYSQRSSCLGVVGSHWQGQWIGWRTAGLVGHCCSIGAQRACLLLACHWCPLANSPKKRRQSWPQDLPEDSSWSDWIFDLRLSDSMDSYCSWQSWHGCGWCQPQPSSSSRLGTADRSWLQLRRVPQLQCGFGQASQTQAPVVAKVEHL